MTQPTAKPVSGPPPVLAAFSNDDFALLRRAVTYYLDHSSEPQNFTRYQNLSFKLGWFCR